MPRRRSNRFDFLPFVTGTDQQAQGRPAGPFLCFLNGPDGVVAGQDGMF